jgi:cell division transport system permease protein
MTKPVETMAEPWDDFEGVAPLALAPPAATPIVPNSSIAGRSLAAVVAIMTFLAALTTGAVMLVVSAASDWQSDVGREVTIQVRPAPGRDLEADVRKAAEIARATPGVADVHAYTKQESARLVEPWLGGGLSLDDLPIPRLIVVKLASGVLPDFEALRRALAAQVAGAMATNRPIIEVLHYVGATDGFIAGQFQRHFLLLGFKGGAIGGGAAIFFFGAAEAANAWLAGTASGDQAAALFGNISIGVSGYLAILTQVILMAMVTALASRRTVNRTLETMD